MKQEDKELLFKDLCARLPYGMKVELTKYKQKCRLCGIDGEDLYLNIDSDPFSLRDFNIKPYLRPMSSMSDEEKEEFRTLIFPKASCAYEDCLEWDVQIVGSGYLQIYVEDFSNVMDWLNTHHFDYRGLIPMGLALEAPEGMYKKI